MRADFLDYPLPEHLIAQEPVARRDASRLLVLRRATDTLEHFTFADLPDLLSPGDLLVVNDSRVLPARLVGRREKTGGKWEGLYLRQSSEGLWELLCQTRGRMTEGEAVMVEPGGLRLVLLRKEGGHWLARSEEPGIPAELLDRHGRVPLPPYIRKGSARDEDRERYQTVYAREPGSVAAPTAGLHFTPEVLSRLEERGIRRASVTLHVGAGTFLPIKADDYRQHKMHAEWAEVPAETVEAIEACRSRGGRVVAVGTTAVRVLETVAAQGTLRPWAGETDLFIHPPYPFRCVEAMVTNFHLPRSTLLLLVSAFAGEQRLRDAYAAAVERRYRFYSYGDAMLIV